MARLAAAPSVCQLEEDEEDCVLLRSQTWFGAGEAEAAALPLPDALGLGLAASTLLTPATPSATIKIAPSTRPRMPRRCGGGDWGGAFIASKGCSMGHLLLKAGGS
jgi:hypothetical protein